MLKTFNILHQCKILPDLVALALRLISTVWAQVEVKCCCDLNNIVKYTEYERAAEASRSLQAKKWSSIQFDLVQAS